MGLSEPRLLRALLTCLYTQTCNEKENEMEMAEKEMKSRTPDFGPFGCKEGRCLHLPWLETARCQLTFCSYDQMPEITRVKEERCISAHAFRGFCACWVGAVAFGAVVRKLTRQGAEGGEDDRPLVAGKGKGDRGLGRGNDRVPASPSWACSLVTPSNLHS